MIFCLLVPMSSCIEPIISLVWVVCSYLCHIYPLEYWLMFVSEF